MPASIDDLIATVSDMSVQFTAVLNAINVQKSFIDNASTLAAGSVTAAAASASAAATSATTASNAATSAANTASSVSGALTSAQNAANSALAALATIGTSLSDAQAAANSAISSKNSAATSATNAGNSATTASTGATTATAQATIATTGANTATTKAAEAAASALTATNTATALSGAAASATAAQNALATIDTKLTAANTAATTATTKASEASASASTASAAATTATTGASTATTKASEASASASTASTGASTATTKAQNASDSAAAAAASAAQASAGQVNPDWNATSGLGQILNKPAIITSVATASILGRNTAGTGAPEVLTVGTVLTMLGLNNVTNTSDANKPVSTATAAAIAALTKASVGLSNVDNTSDVNKPVSSATATAISTAIANLVASSPAALDTLNELATALGNDPAFATTMTTSLGNRLRVDTASQGLSGTQQTNAKTNLALQNVDNTSDANKPVSTAQTTALNLKANQSTTYTKTEVDSAVAATQSFTTGDMLQSARALTAPNWLPCYGGLYLKSSYPALSTLLGIISQPNTLGAGISGYPLEPRCLKYSPDGTLFIQGGLNPAAVSLFSRTVAGVFTAISSPASMPSGRLNGVGFSSDSNLLMLSTTNELAIYSRSGTTFTRLASLGIVNPKTATFSATGNFLVVYSSNGMEMWSFVGTVFTKCPDVPQNDLTSGVTYFEMSADSTWGLSVGTGPNTYSNYVNLYKRVGTQLTCYGSYSLPSNSDISHCAIAPDNKTFVLFGSSYGSFIFTFDFATLGIVNYGQLLGGAYTYPRFSKDGRYIAMAQGASVILLLLGPNSGIAGGNVNIPLPANTFFSNLQGIEFSPDSQFMTSGYLSNNTGGGTYSQTYGPSFDISTLFILPNLTASTLAMGSVKTYIKT